MGRGKSGSVGSKNAPKKSQKKDISPEKKIEDAFNEIDSKNGGTNLVKMSDLRDKTGLSKEDFNKAVFNLRKNKKFTGNSSDGNYETLTSKERDAGISEGGANLVYLSKRYD